MKRVMMTKDQTNYIEELPHPSSIDSTEDKALYFNTHATLTSGRTV